jgi:uncharacterized membrane protein YccC
MKGLVAAIGAEARTIVGYIEAVGQEVSELKLSGPRALQAANAALAVTISTIAALALHLDNVWWAAISGFMSLQASLPASLQKAVLRVIGTVAGAALAVVFVPWLAYDQVACCLFLMVVTTIGVLGVQVSPHGYAWLFTAITTNLVILMSLNHPLEAFHLAVYRVAEVLVGSAVAVLIASLMAPDGPPPIPSAPGWTDLLGARWPAVLHGVRSGITVALVPIVWSWFELTEVSQMAISVAAVMAVPILSDHPVNQGRLIVTRALHRMIGCFFGGVAALAALAIPLTDVLPWIAVLSAGVYIGTYVQQSARGIGYIGTQAGLVFIITLVQGFGPPSTIWPGIDRLGGMMGGLAILLIVSFLLWPSSEDDAPEG